MYEQIEYDVINSWNEPLTPPTFKTKKKLEEWKSDTYIWKEGDKIAISGGAKIFYWLCAVFHDNDRNKMLKDMIKDRHIGQIEEFFKIKKREQQLGFSIKAVNVAKGLKAFEQVEYEAEEFEEAGND